MNSPSASRSASPAAGNSPEQIDASSRLPLFVLFGGAAFWLVVSSVFGLIASIRFHNPNFLADCARLTYGRVYPAWSNLLVYGFCIPAALGVNLWLLARLGRVRMARPWLVAFAAKLWHIGVLFGVLGILRGSSSGFEWLEMPRYAAAILFVSFLLMALCGFITHEARAEESLYPSQWFTLAALFWFPWIYSSATLLLQIFPVRGVVQAAIAWWFAGNLLVVWMGLAGLAASFYFLPKLLNRPLHSQHLALFTFLTLVFFGTWTGIPASAALPAWMPAFSSAATLLTAIPVIAVGLMAAKTACGAKVDKIGGSPCFIRFGLCSFVLAGLMLAATGLHQVSRITDFTWFGPAQNYLRFYGFFAMTIFGAAYYILPRVAGVEFPFAGLIRAHFWLGMLGSLLLSLPLAIGGVVQGFKLLDPKIPIIDVSHSAVMFLRISSTGEVLIGLGALFFLLNVISIQVCFYRALAKKTYMEVTAPLQPAGVKA